MELENIKQNTVWNDAAESINSNFAKIRQKMALIESGAGGSANIDVDTAMSDTSGNAVANKVIKKYVDGKAEQAYEQSNEYTNEEIASLREEIANSNGARAIELQAEWLDGQPHSFGMTWEEYIATPYIVFTFPSNNETDIRVERIASCNRGPQYTDIYAATQIGESEPETSLCLEVTYGEDVGSTNAVVSLVQDIKLLPQFVPVTDDADSKFLNAEGKWVEVQTNVDHPVFEFTYDATTNKATAEMVSALAEAIADNKLILCNGRTYKFILEQDGMYGLVSDAYMDIMDGKLKASVLAVMSSSYDVQLMEEEVPVGTEITEETVRGWGFTKNAGTITGIKMNGATKGTSGVVDLGNVLTEHQKLKTINNQSIVGSGNIAIQGGGGATPRVEMTAASAAIEPNKFYVWPMMDALDLTLGAEQSGVMNRYLFQFRNPKAGLTMLTLPDDITWSEDTELDENGMPVMEAAAFYRIEIIEGLASLKKWKLVYIQFADAEVERVLMSKGVGDGIGITKRDAAAVISFGHWFRENKNVVSFEELKYFTNVKELYERTFWNCENLSLDMTGKLNSVEYIGNGSFANTKAKGTVAFPNLKQVSGIWQNEGLFVNTDIEEVLDLGSVPSLIDGYNENYPGCFGRCTKLRKVVLPDTYRTISPYEFYGCTSLTELMGLGGVNIIGQCACSGCSSLNVDLTGMLGNVEKLATGAFANTKAKGSLSMPNLKQHIGSVWANATFLNTDIEEVLDLGSVASFVDGYNGNYPGCFGKCTKLRKVVLPDTLTATGAFTFYGCTALEVVICLAVTPPTLGASCFDVTNGTFIIYVPDTSVEAYKAATGWNNFAMRIHPMSDYGLLPDIPGLGGYVQDSMLMWLDGIDKGSIPDVWSDLMGNSQFVNNGATVLSNGYEFDGSSYMTGVNAETYSWAGRTFEIVLEFAGNSGTELVYMSNGGISFGRTSSQIIVASGSSAGAYADIYPNFGTGKMVFARQENLGAVINGILTSSNGDNYFDGSGVFLGKRSSGNYFKGKIHAIRIHNRLLTQEEILQNQRLDNERFGLGLDI